MRRGEVRQRNRVAASFGGHCRAMLAAGAVAALALGCGVVDHGSAQSSVARMTIDGVEVQKSGAGERAVILLPGLMTGPWEFAETISRLATRITVYAVTPPGFDGVPATSAPIGGRLHSLEEAVVHLIASERLRAPVLIGHSIGGTLALRLAADHPGILGAVVAIDGLPVFPGTESFSPQQRAEAAERAARILRSADTSEGRLRYAERYLSTVGVLDPQVARAGAPRLAASDFSVAADYIREDITSDDRSTVRRISIPVLEIAPYDAPEAMRSSPAQTEDDRAKYYRELLPAPLAEIAVIGPAHHYVMLDQPERYITVLTGFLDRIR